jgi:hypothetical protein
MLLEFDNRTRTNRLNKCLDELSAGYRLAEGDRGCGAIGNRWSGRAG